jgi:glucan phosphoethanolaminetransferase (alkaline phosphatase superfamily)
MTAAALSTTRLIRLLLVDASLYIGPALAFLAYYVVRHGHNPASIGPHLLLVLALAFGVMSVRLVGGSSRYGAMVATVMACAALLVQWMTYAVFAVGLEHWGRVPTLAMLTAYAGSGWHVLLEVLGIAAWLPWAAMISLCGIVLFAVCVWHRLTPWPPGLRLRARAQVLLLSACLALFGERLHNAALGAHVEAQEPLSLALSTSHWALDAHGHEEDTKSNDEAEGQAAKAYQPTLIRPTRNVILVVADALRADRMSLFGYDRPTTPLLDQRCTDTARCEAHRAVAACGESFCGLLSIARGKAFHESSRSSLRLSQVLQLHGYKYHLVLSGDHTNYYGLANALGPSESYWDGSYESGYANDDGALLRQAEKLPDARTSSSATPVFMQFHLMSTHALGKRRAMSFKPSTNYYGRAHIDHERDAIAFGNFYDNGLLQFDSYLAALLQLLQSKGYLEDAMVLVTADHGEMLGEHGQVSHAQGVYQPVLDIPFVMLRYGHEAPVWPKAPRAQIDLAPTVLAELGLPVPPSWTGRAASLAGSHAFIEFRQGKFAGLMDVRDPIQPRKFWIDALTGQTFYASLREDPKEVAAASTKPPQIDRDLYIKRLEPFLRRVVVRQH